MKNAAENRCSAAMIAIMLLAHFGLEAQPVVTYTQSNCTFTLNTSIASEPIDPAKGESSVGLFYRLDGLNGEGSYFWNSTISGTSTALAENIDLPTGSYTLVTYWSRKGGPIKTGSRVTINNTASCSSTQLPFVNNIISEQVKLSPSWNVFTNPFYSYPPVSHETAATLSTPGDPWLFVTLSVIRWDALGNNGDIAVHFDDAHLDYAGAIADNYDYSQYANWRYAADATYTLNSGVVTVKRKNGVPQPPNSEAHIHLMFKQGNPKLDSLASTLFTAAYTASGGSNASVSASPPVKGTPHDPNSLEVDKEQLCPCQKNESLVYQVNFQNLGSASAKKVTVQISNDPNLILSSVQVLQNTNGDQKTFVKKADVFYDPATRMFRIEPIDLPGTAQVSPRRYEDWETQDYFKFRISKKDCVKNGTTIQPQAGIQFYDDGMNTMGTIHTNLEETLVTDRTSEGISCPDPHPNCTACKKRRCWLLALFCGNR